MLTLTWSPTFLNVRSVGEPGDESRLEISFDTGGEVPGWMGIGFGYRNFFMDGGKQTVVLQVTEDNLCVVEFYLLESNNVKVVEGEDPWSVAPSCFLEGPTATLIFTVGGSSTISLPPQGERLYVLLAAGQGVSLGNHGPNWDYKRIDFLSLDSSGQSTGKSEETSVNPLFLTHGLLFVVNFAILIPATGFLVLVNKLRFLTIHKLLGILIILILTTGWVLVRFAKEESGYASLTASEWGLKHPEFGTAGCWSAVAVCTVGVFLWLFSLPPEMKRLVRFLHALGGVGLAFFGPIVVWTGWLRLSPAIPAIEGLDSTPFVWMTVVFTLGVGVIIGLTMKRSAGTKIVQMGNLVSQEEIDRQISEMGKLILIVEGDVCQVPSNFVHPGGQAVLEAHNGREVGPILRGSTSVNLNGRLRFVPHPQAAFDLIKRMHIGQLDPRDLVINAAAVEVPSTNPDSSARTIGTLVSSERLNASECPVRLFRIKIGVLADLGGVDLGSRVKLSLTRFNEERVERSYTVVGIDESVVEFAIKIYPTGALTNQLQWLKAGDSVSLSCAIPRPPLPSRSNLLFLAGGTGLTPMLSYFSEGVLLWWVRRTVDLFMLRALERPGLKVKLFFTDEEEGSESLKKKPSKFEAFTGRISSDNIRQGMGKCEQSFSDLTVVISGPPGFVEAAHAAVRSLGSDKILSLD